MILKLENLNQIKVGIAIIVIIKLCVRGNTLQNLSNESFNMDEMIKYMYN